MVNFLIDDAQELVQIFGVEINIVAFLSVLFIFMKYDQNCHLYRWQNNWINLFEMRETDKFYPGKAGFSLKEGKGK